MLMGRPPLREAAASQDRFSILAGSRGGATRLASAPCPLDGDAARRFRPAWGADMRKHLSKIVVVIVAIVFATWFLLWPDEEEPVAVPPEAAATLP